jgi:hypothetical protein
MKTLLSSALTTTFISFTAFVTTVAVPSYGHAQDVPPPKRPPLTNEELARKAQNPISDLTSALVENSFNFGVGSSNGLQYIANLEEFYPVRVITELSLVQRFVIPLIAQPELVPGQGSKGGLGDIQYQAYLTSVNATGFIFGFGPVVSVPTAYPNELGSGKWSAGPAAAAVAVLHDWVMGLQGYQLWSISSYNDRPPVSQMQLQPFLFCNLAGAWYVGSSPLITANWKSQTGQHWTVPVGGGIGKVFRIWKQPLKTELQGFDYVVSPQQGPNWGARLQFQILFPSEKENKPSF